jgi:hypothetical protein
MPPSLYPLFLRGGRREERSPYGAVFPGKGAWKGVPFLGVCEATGEAGERLCGWAVEAVQRSLGGSRLSLTSALTRALLSCHRSLSQAPPGERPGGGAGLGMVLGALRGEEVVLAWAGPGMVCLREEGRVSLVPQPAGGPLGTGGETVPVALHRFSFPPALALLVSHSLLRRFTTPQGLEAILSAEPARALDRLAVLVGGEPAFAAVLTA